MTSAVGVRRRGRAALSRLIPAESRSRLYVSVVASFASDAPIARRDAGAATLPIVTSLQHYPSVTFSCPSDRETK